MKKTLFVSVLAAFLFGFTLGADADIPRRAEVKPVNDNGVQRVPFIAKLVGEWRGLGETRNRHAKPESLKVVVNILADGTVTGHVGEWKLKDAKIGRTTPHQRQAYMAEFIITGQAEGMKSRQDGKNLVSITLDFKGTTAEGTIRGFAEDRGGKIIEHRWNLTHFNLYPMK